MIYLRNVERDLVFEISNLVSLFTSEFSFLDDSEVFNAGDSKEDILLRLNGISTSGDKKKRKSKIKRYIYDKLSEIYDVRPPWGILTGIRPSKIVHDLMDKGVDIDDIKEILRNEYYISDDRIKLLLDVCSLERKYIYPVNQKKISLYICIPFCPTRCYYCSFPSNKLDSKNDKREKYIQALKKEIEDTSKLIDKKGYEIETLYIGGGTPTALEAHQIEEIIKSCFDNFNLSNMIEFTVEAGRPDTINKEKLEILKKYGVNRISINPQTMNDSTLERIGRSHTSEDVQRIFEMAREIGFDNINMDIIIGLEGEDINDLRCTLESISKLKPDSLTVHTLAIKKGSILKSEIDKDGINKHISSLDEMEEKIKLSKEMARNMGMHPYYMYRQKYMAGNLENIGYCTPSKECIYNIQIMEERQTNIGLGAGSITKLVFFDENRVERVSNVKNLDNYISRVEEMVKRKYDEMEEDRCQ